MADRVGRRDGSKKVTYTSFIEPHSFMSARKTVHFTTRSSDEPLRAKTPRMFSIAWRVSA